MNKYIHKKWTPNFLWSFMKKLTWNYSTLENALVTIVTSVPWERERDITGHSSLWELLPFQPFWSPIGSRQSKWLANCRKVCKSHANTDKLRGSINAVYVTVTSESKTECRLAGRAASTATSVMSRSRSQGTEVTIVTGAFPLELSWDITEKFSVMGMIFNPAVREAMSNLPCTMHSSEDRTHTPFPPIATLEVGLAADWWR